MDGLYYQSKYYFVYVHAYTADKIIEHILEGFLEFAKASAIQSLLPLCEQCIRKNAFVRLRVIKSWNTYLCLCVVFGLV